MARIELLLGKLLAQDVAPAFDVSVLEQAADEPPKARAGKWRMVIDLRGTKDMPAPVPAQKAITALEGLVIDWG